MLRVSSNVRKVPFTDIRHEARNPTRLTRIRVAADAGDVVAQGDVDLGEHSRGGNRTLDRKWAEMRGDKAVRRKAALTVAGGKYQEQLKRPWRTFRW